MKKMPAVKYYDIGLNLFSKQFSDPEAVIEAAAAAGYPDRNGPPGEPAD